jgi:hypothetical protein
MNFVQKLRLWHLFPEVSFNWFKLSPKTKQNQSLFLKYSLIIKLIFIFAQQQISKENNEVYIKTTFSIIPF